MKTKYTILTTLAFCASLAAHANSGSTSAPAPGTGMSPSGSTSASDSNAAGQTATTGDMTTTGKTKPPAGGTASSPVTGSLRSRQSVMDAQQALVNQGFSLSVDGVSGPQTRNAVRQFQARQGLPETGTLDQATMDALRSGGATQPTASDTSAE